MKQKSQKEIVREKLLEDGSVTRNWCLANYITRLAAIIALLKAEGYQIEAKDEGGDYRYSLVGVPKKIEERMVSKVIIEGNVAREVRVLVNA